MEPTTDGTFRVLASPYAEDELVLLGVETGEATDVGAAGYAGTLAESVAEIQPGNRITATLSWNGSAVARFERLTIETRTLVTFIEGVTGLFEAASQTWREARMQGVGVNSRVTENTDGDPNGVVYTFAQQPGASDLYAEFRDGTRPLEPLIARLAEDTTPPFEVFVLRPADQPFVLVYLVFEKKGMLAETVRETYE